MSKNTRTRDRARHFVTKIALPKASDVTPYFLKKNSAVLGDLKKWSKNHWRGGRPLLPPHGGTPGNRLGLQYEIANGNTETRNLLFHKLKRVENCLFLNFPYISSQHSLWLRSDLYSCKNDYESDVLNNLAIAVLRRIQRERAFSRSIRRNTASYLS